MSTYLVEVVIGLFDYVEDHTSDGMVILYVLLTFLPYFMVLTIFPRLVGLPLEKFQMALAHILQVCINSLDVTS
ncbi:hypothetical protein Patl1_15669 [Pistacia atlantica]|uniref:Uncharacterized protein n=1 Tax=Pistacia atlantica TaxID=434234 RepID=A0ACC1B7S6_9ROSI|nr:hypothetical protein Patl1_15669 [Pistacia atlantica]